MAAVSGPISVLCGLGAAAISRYVVVPGIGKNAMATALVEVVTFGVGAGVTALLHHKWFTNLAKYWETFQKDPSIRSAAKVPRLVTAAQAQAEAEPQPPAAA
jgi:hypothetical protein